MILSGSTSHMSFPSPYFATAFIKISPLSNLKPSDNKELTRNRKDCQGYHQALSMSAAVCPKRQTKSVSLRLQQS